MTQAVNQTNDKTIEEIKTDHYALTYATDEDAFHCADCNTEQDGIHMEHSIFFKEFTDVAPMCLSCVSQHYVDFV